jgi:hypothetical protein
MMPDFPIITRALSAADVSANDLAEPEKLGA